MADDAKPDPPSSLTHILVHAKAPRWSYKSASSVGSPAGKGVSAAPAYDFVVIGGGTAGCALAARLSERSDFKVLLLEAGGSGDALLLSHTPGSYPILFHSKHDWNLYTTPQKNTNNRKWFWPRGKMLGGSSAINAMMYHYGAPEDFLEWPGDGKAPGANEWTYEKIKPYYQKFEKFFMHPLYPNVKMEHRSTEGGVETGFNSHTSEWTKAFISSCETAGIPITPDLNTLDGSLGVSKIMTYIDHKGRRSTSETGYLKKDVLARPNLTVATGAHVTKLIIEERNGSKIVSGIEYADGSSPTASRYVVKVNKEALLCAGACHSPQILMLSGIGPASHLQQHNIPVHVDLPGVGKNLLDHPTVDTMWRIKKGSLAFIRPGSGFVSLLRAGAALTQHMLFGTGPLTTNIAEAAAFIRTDDQKLFPSPEYNSIQDTTSGPGAPDLELFCAPVPIKRHGDEDIPSGETAGMIAVLLRPTSKGTITLRSNSPFDDPIIDPNYFSTQHDLDVLVRGLRIIANLAKQPALKEQLDESEKSAEFDQDMQYKTDKELEEIVRDRSETLYHPTSTVKMAPREKEGCVDYFLRVYDIGNLRVADDSILPNIISGHTAGPAFAIGEKTADMIKATYPTSKL